MNPEVIPVGTRAGTQWLVIAGGRTALFLDEAEARNFAQLLVAGVRAPCPTCGCGWVKP